MTALGIITLYAAVSLVVDGACRSHCISVRCQHTQVGGAKVRGDMVYLRVQIVAWIVSGIVLDSGSHVVRCTIQQHIFHHLSHHKEINTNSVQWLNDQYSYLMNTGIESRVSQ